MIADLEDVIKLMVKYEIDEFANANFTIKKSKHKQEKSESVVTMEKFQKHLEAQPEEPWMSIDEKQLNNFTTNGKI